MDQYDRLLEEIVVNWYPLRVSLHASSRTLQCRMHAHGDKVLKPLPFLHSISILSCKTPLSFIAAPARPVRGRRLAKWGATTRQTRTVRVVRM